MCANAWRYWWSLKEDGAPSGGFGLLSLILILNLGFTSTLSLDRDLLCRLTSAGGLPFPQPSPMAMNKRERGCDKPITASFSESSQPMIQDDTPRMITGSRRRVNKDLPDPRLSKRTDQLHHQSNRRYQLPSMSSSQSQLEQPNQNQQHPDPSTTFPTPFTRTYTLPMYSDELGRLPLHGHLNSSAPYLDQTNDGYPNRGSSAVGGSSEGNANPDHTVLSNASTSSYLSQHSNRRQYQQAQDHNHHPPITIRTMTPIGPKQAQWHQNSPLNQRWDREVWCSDRGHQGSSYHFYISAKSGKIFRFFFFFWKTLL